MIVRFFKWLLGLERRQHQVEWQQRWTDILNQKVAFYRALSEADKTLFNQRILLFLHTTSVEAGQFEVTEDDRLLVAASAIIPVWAFPKWHYFNVHTVYLLPASFNQQFQCGQPDSVITGMVGTGPMSGKLALSRPHLHLGFSNSRDKRNVGIHEFVHLIDMTDGDCDGYPEALKAFAFSLPWFDLVDKKTEQIYQKNSNIDNYATTNRAEFLCVVTEYFFERPKQLKQKHPKLYESLQALYQQDTAAIALEIQVARNAPCPCGSGKKFKRCCMPKD